MYIARWTHYNADVLFWIKLWLWFKIDAALSVLYNRTNWPRRAMTTIRITKRSFCIVQNPYSMRILPYDWVCAVTETCMRIFPDLIAVMQFFFEHTMQRRHRDSQAVQYYWNISLVCQCRWNNQSQFCWLVAVQIQVTLS